jgi:thioredoxin reductase (NADPH)
VQGLTLIDTTSGQRTTVEVDGLLVWIGLEPNTDYLRGIVALDQGRYVLIDHRMATNVPGIFAAGDTRCQSAMQVATATGDGITVAIAAHKLFVEGR